MSRKENFDFTGLPEAVADFLASNGKYGTHGDWQINNGLDEIWWVLYYKNEPLIRCKKGILWLGDAADTFNPDAVKILTTYLGSEYLKLLQKHQRMYCVEINDTVVEV